MIEKTFKITCDDCKIETYSNSEIPQNWEKFGISQYSENPYEISIIKNL